MYEGKSIAVVVPAFNESKFIGPTLASIPAYVDSIYSVDDASTDQTLQTMKDWASKDPRIRVIERPVNGGVGAAVVSGYVKAVEDSIDIVVVMAGDGQMDPSHLRSLLDPIVEGRAEYTKGNRLFDRKLRAEMSSWRYAGNILLTYLNKIASGYYGIVDPQNGYTAITTRALRMLNLSRIYPRYAFENDLLVKLNVFDIPVLNIPIPARYGEEESKIRYGSFIPKTLAFFMRAYCWRIWHKYISKDAQRLELHSVGSPCPAIASQDGTVTSRISAVSELKMRLSNPGDARDDRATPHEEGGARECEGGGGR